jgi:hypothetical protein
VGNIASWIASIVRRIITPQDAAWAVGFVLTTVAAMAAGLLVRILQ